MSDMGSRFLYDHSSDIMDLTALCMNTILRHIDIEITLIV